MAKAQDPNSSRSKLIKGTKVNVERQTRNDGNCSQKGLSLQQLRRHFDGSLDTKKKLERIRLPAIHARNKRRQRVRSPTNNLKRENRKIHYESSSEITPVRQMMPKCFEEFWLQYKSSLADRQLFFQTLMLCRLRSFGSKTNLAWFCLPYGGTKTNEFIILLDSFKSSPV